MAIVQPFTLYMFDRNTAYIICQIVFASIYHIARIFIGDPDTVSYKDLTSPSPTSALQLVIVLVLFILIMEHDNKRLFLRQLSAKQKATAAITHKNEFLRYMFHELRIPINVMFLAIDLMVERINDSGCISLGTECEMSRKIADAPRLDTNSGKEKDNYKSDSRSVSNSNSDRSSSSSSSAKSGDCSDDKTDKSNDETDENSRSVIRARARPSARSPASSQTRTTTHVDDVKGGDEGEGFGYLIDLLNVQCKSIQSLLNDSLFLQKLEQRKVELEAACFSFPSLLDRICFSHRLSAQKKGVNIEVVMDSHVPVWTLGDQSRLRYKLYRQLHTRDTYALAY